MMSLRYHGMPLIIKHHFGKVIVLDGGEKVGNKFKNGKLVGSKKVGNKFKNGKLVEGNLFPDYA